MKQLKLWGVALAAAVSVLSVSAQTKDEVSAKMKEAGELVNAKKFVEAIPVLEEVIQMGLTVGADATDITSQAQTLLPKLYLQKGVMAVRANKMDEALEALGKAENLADLQGDVMTTRQAGRFISNIYMAQGIESFNAKDYAKALEVFQKGVDQDPDNIQLMYYTAKSHAELGNLETAVTLYNKVIAAGAENSKFKSLADNSQNDLNTYILVAASTAAQAGEIEKVQEYVALIPTSADANLLLIQTANNLKKYDIVTSKGADAYAAQTDPAKQSDIAYLMGVAFQNRGNSAQAIQWLGKVTTGSNVAAAQKLKGEIAASQQ